MGVKAILGGAFDRVVAAVGGFGRALGDLVREGRRRAPAAQGVARAGVATGVLLVAASAVAGLVVTLQLTLTGDTASRALWAAIAAASVPVLIILAGEFGNLFRRLVGRDPHHRHLVALTVLAVVLTGSGPAVTGGLRGE